MAWNRWKSGQGGVGDVALVPGMLVYVSVDERATMPEEELSEHGSMLVSSMRSA